MASITELLVDPAAWAAFIGLVAMEIALGIDNLVFLSLLTSQLPERQRRRAQRIGLGLALLIRVVGLVFVASIVQLTTPVFSLLGHDFSWRDVILLAGGIFLIWKATTEIRQRIDPDARPSSSRSTARTSFMVVVVEIPLFDLVFSIDSIITAVGMTEHLPIMVAAIVVAMAVMLLAASSLSAFLQTYPSLTILALGFLLLIGVTLVAEAFGTHFPRGYIYSAMAFSSLIVALDLLSRRAQRLQAGRSDDEA
jgi:predicted tellurium resistance membrane protein TerC